MASLWGELKRRNVIRMTVLYSVAGWVLLQIADILFGLLDVPGWGLRLVLGLLLLGLPLVVIFSWVFEMTPEGIKRESDVDRSQSVTTNTGRKIDRLIIFGLVAIVAVLLADRFLLMSEPREQAQVAEQGPAETAADSGDIAEPPAEPADDLAGDAQPKSIAVLPFVNMSGDEENEYFSDGLTEELLNLLAKVDDLRVSSRTSSFAFKGKDASLPSVARELNVANILEGSVRKSGATIRITAQLIDVDTDSHLWSETYDRQLDDIFAVQDEIAQAVVDVLKVRLLESGETSTQAPRETSTDAYILYLRARHTYELARDTDDIDLLNRAIEQYQSVLEIDPDYALAYAGLADAYGFSSIQGVMSQQAGYERSREMAEKALSIDPDLVEALLALADVQLEYDWDTEAAERSYLRALELRPSDAEGLRTYGYFLSTEGRFDEAISYYKRALEVDPMQLRAYFGLGITLIFADRHEDVPWLTEKLEKHRDERFMGMWNYRMNMLTLRFQNRWEELIEVLPAEPESIGDLQDAAIAYYHTGNAERANEYLQRLTEACEESKNEYSTLAAALVQMDQTDRALEYLEKSVQVREVNLSFIRNDPDFEPLFDDPRFLDLLERAGIQPPKKGSG